MGSTSAQYEQQVRQQMERYNTLYEPVRQMAFADLNSMDIVNSAYSEASMDKGPKQAEAERERMAGRYGIQSSRLHTDEATRMSGLNAATDYAHLLNMARSQQQKRNYAFQNQLMNIGRGLESQAMSGLGRAAESEGARENSNRQAKAQQSAQKTQMMASIGMIAIAAS